MEFLLTHDTLKVPEVTMQRWAYWQPFHIENGSGEIRELEDNTAAVDVVAALPAEFDGFWIGNRIELILTLDGKLVKTGKIHESDGFLYIPEGRCRTADLDEVLTFNPSFAGIMISQGLSTALRVTNGYIANDPASVRIVRTT